MCRHFVFFLRELWPDSNVILTNQPKHYIGLSRTRRITIIYLNVSVVSDVQLSVVTTVLSFSNILSFPMWCHSAVLCVMIVVQLGILSWLSFIISSWNPSTKTVLMGCISLHINLAPLSVLRFMNPWLGTCCSWLPNTTQSDYAEHLT